MKSRIPTVLVCVDDMKASIELYRDILGLPCIKTGNRWSEFDEGGIKLGLHIQDSGAGVKGSRPVHRGEFSRWHMPEATKAGLQSGGSGGIPRPGHISHHNRSRRSCLEHFSNARNRLTRLRTKLTRWKSDRFALVLPLKLFNPALWQ